MIKAKKRGISPLIATVLLIGFVIALILIVVLWGKNYIEELAAKRGALAQKQQECQIIDVTVKSISQPTGNQITIIVENLKDKPIDKFVFRGLTEGDESDVVENFERLAGLEIKSYDITFGMGFGTGGIKKIDIIPELKAGKNKYVPCSDKHVTVKVNA
ncbi:MAG: archaellin/type IV pilin N-terminal domain-containing protein [archaeon]